MTNSTSVSLKLDSLLADGAIPLFGVSESVRNVRRAQRHGDTITHQSLKFFICQTQARRS